jgi:hypothetical protein
MAVWKSLQDGPPPLGSKFVALYDDGSGARLFFRHNEGFICADGDEEQTLDGMYDKWTELPQGFEFWCESRSEPMTLSLTPQESE